MGKIGLHGNLISNTRWLVVVWCCIKIVCGSLRAVGKDQNTTKSEAVMAGETTPLLTK